MKKLLILIPFILLSCKNDVIPTFNDKNRPFVITKIESINDNQAEYYSNDKNNNNQAGLVVNRPSIILPSRMFNIGDTIIIR
jgi:hypothetical protein